MVENMNEIFAVHYDGKLMSSTSGLRTGAIYTTIGPAKSYISRIKAKCEKWPTFAKHYDLAKFSIVRYVPESGAKE